MKNQKTDNARRSFLKGIAAIPVVSIAGFQTAAQAGGHGTMLSVDDPTAKALGYVETSVVAGKNCANCNLYTGAVGSTKGPCAIFPGKMVTAAGYCNSWIPKM
ncbi:MAG: high-potential iron-sulfur protein [Gammaproteobacteria bacterium]|nr:high-potential iron-sulfur protein [Gammaproteobacteria bacterium]